MKDYLSELNSVQKSAVIETEGPVMVIAGPGSGKLKCSLQESLIYLQKELNLIKYYL